MSRCRLYVTDNKSEKKYLFGPPFDEGESETKGDEAQIFYPPPRFKVSIEPIGETRSDYPWIYPPEGGTT